MSNFDKKMKDLASLIGLLFLFFATSWGQSNCKPLHRTVPFYANAIRTSVGSHSELFSYSGPGFLYPGYQTQEFQHLPSLIFQQQFWIGGRGEDGDWRSSLVLMPYQDLDFVNGPASLDPAECADWGHVWVVNGYEIAALKMDFLDGIIDTEPAYPLLVWPGRGNPYIENLMGISLPDQLMAPFQDVNLDGIYDPFSGDYPIVGEDCPTLVPTQIAWTIYNDHLGYKFLSDGLALGVEVGVTVFAVDFPSPDRSLEESVFLRYDILNISGEPLSDVRVGHFVDAEIGCGSDDLVGCYPEAHTFFAYNNGPEPEICLGGIPSYGEFPPVLTTTFLSDTLHAFLYWNRLAPWAELLGVSIPQVIEHVFHGRWPDGTLITEGGSGYNSGGDPTTLVFTGIPSDTTSWAHINVTNNDFGDRRLFGITQPFGLPVGGRKVHYAVYSAHRKSGLTPPLQVDYALSRIPFIQSFYQTCFTLPTGNPLPCLADCVWPGDMDANGICNNLDLLEWGISLDRTGNPRNLPFIGWLPQDASYWGKTENLNTDARHQDANGDGVIDRLDVFAINENFGKSAGGENEWGGVTIDGPEIKLKRIFNSLTSPDELLTPGKKFMIQFDVAEWPVDSIYSLGYSITYDPAVVSLETGFNQTPKSSYFVDSCELFVHPEDGHLDIGMTRTDHANLKFIPFELGKLMFRIKTDAPQIQFPDTTWIEIRHVKAYLADGTLLSPGSQTVKIPFGLSTNLDWELPTHSAFQIEPNPTSGNLNWKATIPLHQLELYSIQGGHIHRWGWQDGKTSGEIHLDGPSGIYLLVGRGKNGIVQRVKVVKF